MGGISGLAFCLTAFFGYAWALWPLPREFNITEQFVRIKPGLDFHLSVPDALLDRAISRSVDLITTGFKPWMLHPLGIYDVPGLNESSIISDVYLINNSTAFKEGSEDYSINITDLDIVIEASSQRGMLHGLTSFVQLCFTDLNSDTIYAPRSYIDDGPVFAYRGISMDVARNWYPPADILKLLDGMALSKMNKLHLHLTDSQSWVLELPSLPLVTKGAYSPEHTYSLQDIDMIIEYAADRGIDVIIEIDSPGHIASLVHSYPSVITSYNRKPYSDWAKEPPSGQLKLGDSDAEELLGTIFNDILPHITSGVFHLGFDEVDLHVYQDQLSDVKDIDTLRPYLQHHFSYLQGILQKHNVTPMVWEEAVLEYKLELPPNTLVQHWKDAAAIKEITRQGYDVVVGGYDYWYLDCGKGQWVDMALEKGKLYKDYCAPYKNWKRIYTFEPLDSLTDEEARHVVGGELHIWSESIDYASVHQEVWPRTSAGAEVLWSGPISMRPVDIFDISQRLNELRWRLVEQFKIDAASIQPVWCSQRKGDCGA